MDIVSKMLPPAVAIEYLTDTLSQIEVGGADVTRVLLSGSMSALVPDSTPDNRVCDFKHGGILAPIDDLSVVVQKTVQPVANTAEVLAKQLVQLDGLECLIHDPLKKIGEAAMADGVPILVEGSLFEACGRHGVDKAYARLRLKRLSPDPGTYRRLVDADGALSAEEASFALALAQCQ
jgi:hypothetical protein